MQKGGTKTNNLTDTTRRGGSVQVSVCPWELLSLELMSGQVLFKELSSVGAFVLQPNSNIKCLKKNTEEFAAQGNEPCLN